MTLKKILGIEQSDEEVLLKLKEARESHKETIALKQTDGTEVLIRVFKSDFRGPAEKAQGGH